MWPISEIKLFSKHLLVLVVNLSQLFIVDFTNVNSSRSQKTQCSNFCNQNCCWVASKPLIVFLLFHSHLFLSSPNLRFSPKQNFPLHLSLQIVSYRDSFFYPRKPFPPIPKELIREILWRRKKINRIKSFAIETSWCYCAGTSTIIKLNTFRVNWSPKVLLGY